MEYLLNKFCRYLLLGLRSRCLGYCLEANKKAYPHGNMGRRWIKCGTMFLNIIGAKVEINLETGNTRRCFVVEAGGGAFFYYVRYHRVRTTYCVRTQIAYKSLVIKFTSDWFQAEFDTFLSVCDDLLCVSASCISPNMAKITPRVKKGVRVGYRPAPLSKKRCPQC